MLGRWKPVPKYAADTRLADIDAISFFCNQKGRMNGEPKGYAIVYYTATATATITIAATISITVTITTAVTTTITMTMTMTIIITRLYHTVYCNT